MEEYWNDRIKSFGTEQVDSYCRVQISHIMYLPEIINTRTDGYILSMLYVANWLMCLVLVHECV